MILELWYLTPLCLVASCLATSVAVGGPVFYTPLFVLALELPPSVAVATALLTQVFGFTSATASYWRRGLIDFELARSLAVVAAPAALTGSLLAPLVPGLILRRTFGLVALVVAYRVVTWRPTTLQTDRDRRASTTRRGEGTLLAGLGGLLAGMTSIGLAETQGYHLIVRRGVRPQTAVATTVVVVVTSVAAAAAGHLFRLALDTNPGPLTRVLDILIFTVPGVLLGGQLGPMAQARMSQRATTRLIGVVLAAAGLTMVLI